jgi:hypothetical protein
MSQEPILSTQAGALWRKLRSKRVNVMLGCHIGFEMRGIVNEDGVEVVLKPLNGIMTTLEGASIPGHHHVFLAGISVNSEVVSSTAPSTCGQTVM